MTGRRQLAGLRMGMLSARRALSTRPEFAAEISRLYDQSLEGMVEIGRRLLEARDALPHGEFESMVEEDLPFSPTAAYRLRRVAEFVDSGAVDKAALPGNYTTVFELASLSEDELQAAQARGLVHAAVTRKTLIAFKAELRGTAALPAPTVGEELVLGAEADVDGPALKRAAPVIQPPVPPTPGGGLKGQVLAQPGMPVAARLPEPPPEDPDEPPLPFEPGPARDGEVLPPSSSAGRPPEAGIVADAEAALRRLQDEEQRIRDALHELERQVHAHNDRLLAISKERAEWCRRLSERVGEPAIDVFTGGGYR